MTRAGKAFVAIIVLLTVLVGAAGAAAVVQGDAEDGRSVLSDALVTDDGDPAGEDTPFDEELDTAD